MVRMRDNVQIIGLSGYAGSGKDYISNKFFVEYYNFHNISLAWHFKIECIAKGQATFDEVFYTKPPRVRKLLQILGTEQGRDLWGYDIWVDTLFAWIRLFHTSWGMNKFIIPDVRFPNELESIKAAGGKVFRVISDREHQTMTAEAREHESERALTDKMVIFDGTIINTKDTTDDQLRAQIDKLMEE